MRLFAVLALAVLLCAGAAQAGSFVHAHAGARIEAWVPSDPDLWGQGLLDEKWVPAVLGPDNGPGLNDEQFIGPGRPWFLLVPGITQEIFFDNGFAIEIAERIVHVLFAPNRGLDIHYSRYSIPITITPQYRFAFGPRDQFRPYVGAGAGFYYTATTIEGSDLYDREMRGERELREPRRFSRSEWNFGALAVAGIKWFVLDRMAITLAAGYEYVDARTTEIRLVEDGPGAHHWEDRTIGGDGGGTVFELGVSGGF